MFFCFSFHSLSYGICRNRTENLFLRVEKTPPAFRFIRKAGLHSWSRRGFQLRLGDLFQVSPGHPKTI